MQTKNVNMAPLNNTVCGTSEMTSESQLIVAPPLPPRGPHQTARIQTADVEGSGAYKPVPPPKPVPCHSPPPYRMPPYPLYSEPSATSAPAIPGASDTQNNLHTHSSKFPIEREVILSSTDKNSKIPILNEYRKRSKTAIAPDAPNKQIAWTEEKNRAQPMTLLDSSQGSEPSPIRSQDQINGYPSPSPATVSTGAVPRTPVHSTPEDSNGKTFPTRTYHTIKDMISSRFNKRETTQQQHQHLSHQSQVQTASQSQMSQLPSQPQPQTPQTPHNKIDDNLSPQSQLRQHGVYLATSAQQQSRAMNVNTPSSNEVMRRNQEIRMQLERERREREADEGGFQEIMHNRAVHGGSKHSVIDIETPRRNQDMMYTTREIIQEQRTPSASRRTSAVLDGGGGGIRPGEMYSRTPASQASYYSNDGGYGIPSNKKNLIEMENARRMSEADSIQVLHRRGSEPGRLDEIAGASGGGPGRGNVAHNSNNNLPGTPRLGSYNHNDNNNHAHRINNNNQDDKTQSLGVYTTRTPVETPRNITLRQQPQHTREETRTSCDYRLINKTEFSDRRNIFQSNERLDAISTAASVGNIVKESNKEQMLNVNNEIEDNHRLKDDLDDEDNDHHGFTKSVGGGGANSDYEKLRGGGAQSDSGRGSTVYSSGKAKTERNIDTSPEPLPHPGANDSQWVDIVETELRHILDPKLHHSVANSTLSESISSVTPPLPPLSPGGSSDDTGPTYKHKGLGYSLKGDFKGRGNGPRGTWSGRPAKDKTPHHRHGHSKRETPASKLPPTLMCSSLELDSMLDENNSSDELSTTVDTADTRAIRKQLEGLENMYSEVLKLLGVKKQTPGGKYQASDPRIHKRRLYGSLSSLPSSVSSRPIRHSDKRRHDDRKKVKDVKSINKRFQRLESHVVTLARSVAHLSSEMRTQHLMIQEMEVIRGELAALRAQTNMVASRSQSLPRALNKLSIEQSNSTPDRVKRLTKFFGDEPPLMRLFLKKLGYEKYASTFENERIGLVELPYLSEERLHKLGIPLGPRLRILQEAQLGVTANIHENTLCIV
ncbi:uncharacterized protein LOC142331397 isoform X2 [Lycorma delicatula]|uniref:uncharacterized protein LOC142331397 isoform X2 n=1 Tax=Lycorma delicatula TaxID=130591 RepID=UPI003F513D89